MTQYGNQMIWKPCITPLLWSLQVTRMTQVHQYVFMFNSNRCSIVVWLRQLSADLQALDTRWIAGQWCTHTHTWKNTHTEEKLLFWTLGYVRNVRSAGHHSWGRWTEHEAEQWKTAVCCHRGVCVVRVFVCVHALVGMGWWWWAGLVTLSFCISPCKHSLTQTLTPPSIQTSKATCLNVSVSPHT